MKPVLSQEQRDQLRRFKLSISTIDKIDKILWLESGVVNSPASKSANERLQLKSLRTNIARLHDNITNLQQNIDEYNRQELSVFFQCRKIEVELKRLSLMVNQVNDESGTKRDKRSNTTHHTRLFCSIVRVLIDDNQISMIQKRGNKLNSLFKVILEALSMDSKSVRLFIDNNWDFVRDDVDLEREFPGVRQLCNSKEEQD